MVRGYPGSAKAQCMYVAYPSFFTFKALNSPPWLPLISHFFVYSPKFQQLKPVKTRLTRPCTNQTSVAPIIMIRLLIALAKIFKTTGI